VHSAVVELAPGLAGRSSGLSDAERIGNGGLYFNSCHHDEAGHWLAYTNDFDRWAKGVLDWVRQSLGLRSQGSSLLGTNGREAAPADDRRVTSSYLVKPLPTKPE
jgi:hypothetical protein